MKLLAPRPTATRRVVTLVVALLALQAAACRQSTTADDYDQTCAEDSECVPIHSGDWCPYPYCQCDNAAINKDDEKQYSEDVQAVACGPDIFPVDCIACPRKEGFCDSGRCDLRDAPPPGAIP